jgi:hypothetical protein
VSEQPRENVKGTVYLLHIEPPYHHAKHYLGWTEFDVEGRVAYHVSGYGNKLIRAAVKAGHGIIIARTWSDEDRNFERTLKNRKNAPRLCPICNGE